MGEAVPVVKHIFTLFERCNGLQAGGTARQARQEEQESRSGRLISTGGRHSLPRISDLQIATLSARPLLQYWQALPEKHDTVSGQIETEMDRLHHNAIDMQEEAKVPAVYT